MARQSKKSFKEKVGQEEKEKEIVTSEIKDEDTKEYPENSEALFQLFYGDVEKVEVTQDGDVVSKEGDADKDKARKKKNIEKTKESFYNEVEEEEEQDEELEEEEFDAEDEEEEAETKNVKSGKKDEEVSEEDSSGEKASEKQAEYIRKLKSELEKLQSAVNILKEIGIDPNQPQQALLSGLRELKSFVDDIKVAPEIVNAIQKVYEEGAGLFDEEEITPQDFMPDGEIFDQEEVFDPKTPSYKAYKKWQREIAKRESKKEEFFQKLSRMKEQGNNVVDGVIKGKEILEKSITNVKARVYDEFGIDDDVWEEFLRSFAQADENALYGAFVGYASTKGIEPVKLRVMKKNKRKKKPVAKKDEYSSRYEELGYEISKDQEELYKELFGEE
jgi:hypothetical protein